MTEGIKTPPKFDGLNFLIWKVKMIIILQSLGSRVAKAVTKLFIFFEGVRTLGPIFSLKNLMIMLKTLCIVKIFE